MNNKDKSAFPTPHSIDGNWQKEPKQDFRGLTKREYVASLIVQSIINRKGVNLLEINSDIEDAFMYADELLKDP